MGLPRETLARLGSTLPGIGQSAPRATTLTTVVNSIVKETHALRIMEIDGDEFTTERNPGGGV